MKSPITACASPTMVLYPFGMITLGRSWDVGSGYRYGFNNQEQDAETYKKGNSIDYGSRIYDPRLGKFESIDPMTGIYCHLSPYSFANNSPVYAIDLGGYAAWIVTRRWSENDIKGFAEFTKAQIDLYKEQNVKDDCANIALRLIIDYAYVNGLPIQFVDGDNTVIDMNNFDNYDDFLNAVRDKISAKDLLLNTVEVTTAETQAGDMEIMHYSRNNYQPANFEHTVIFYQIDNTNFNYSDVAYGTLPVQTLKIRELNWPRFQPLDPNKSKWTIYTGSNNSRWKVISDANIASTTPIEIKPLAGYQFKIEQAEPQLKSSSVKN